MDGRLLVIQHEEECPPAWFGEWIEAAGVDVVVVRGDLGEQVPDSAAGFDGLLVLGGEMGAYDDARYPWLTSTKALIAHAVGKTVPFLGICLGHQLGAVALGGAVVTNPAGTAVGLTPLGLTEAGRHDDLLSAVAEGDRAVQWNSDIVTVLPARSRLLAVAPDGSAQAIAFDTRAWGVQFHPEVSPEVFGRWELDTAGPTNGEARADVLAAGDELAAAWRPLAERFATIVLAARAAADPPHPAGSSASGSPASGQSDSGLAGSGSAAVDSPDSGSSDVGGPNSGA